jgi:uncharacterized membrane-anchored protein
MTNKLHFGQKRSRLLWILIALQVLFLALVTSSYYAVDWVGKEIRVKTIPVDPTDLFYGDYVTLNYEMNQPKPNLWKGSKPVQNGEAVYVVLQPELEIYHATAVYPDKPSLHGNEVLIRGRMVYSGDDFMRIDYGLERYYLPEGTGADLEKKRGNLIVRVKIAPWGQMKIASLEN